MPAPSVPTILGREPGAMGGSNTVGSVQIPLNMGKQIAQWHKEEFPFGSLIMGNRRKSIPNIKGYHLEDKEFPHWVTYSGSDETAGSEATTFGSGEIVGWDRLNVYDLVFWPRIEETFLFTAVDATPVVVRGGNIGGTTRPLKTGDTGYRFSSMKDEGGVARDSMSTIKERLDWYAQEWRHASELTYETAVTEMYGDPGVGGQDERKYQLKKWRYEHKKEIANSLIFNDIGGDYATNTSPTAGFGHQRSWGLMGKIQTHIWNCNGSLKWDALKGFLMSILAYNTDNILCVTSMKGIDIMTSYGNDFVQITPKQKYWGWEFDELHVGGKRVALVHEPSLDEDKHLAGMGFLASPKRIAYHPVIGNGLNLDTHLNLNIKTDNNVHLFKDEYTTTGGWEFFVEAGFGRWYAA